MLKLLFGLKGRMTRLWWWLARLGAYPAAFVAMMLVAAVMSLAPEGDLPSAIEGLLVVLIVVALTWIEIATSIRRLHDLDLSGWFYLVSLVPLVGLVFYVVVLGCLPGTKGRNNYGPPPNGKAATERAADVFA